MTLVMDRAVAPPRSRRATTTRPKPRSKPGLGDIAQRVLLNPTLLRLLRKHRPVFRLPLLGRPYLITRYEDGRDVLSNDAVFPTPFGPKMKRTTRAPDQADGGPNFMLGMSDGAVYRRDRAVLTGLLRREDLQERVAPLIRPEAAAILHKGRNPSGEGRIDVVYDLFRRLPCRVVEDYFGVRLIDPPGFTDLIMDVSRYIFADFRDSPATERNALAAAAQVRAVIDAAFRKPPVNDTLIDRAVALNATGVPGSDFNTLIAMMMGAIVGYIPNLTISATNILLVLLKRSRELALARRAALSGDDDLFARCLDEALRFDPMLPIIRRTVSSDQVLAEGSGRPRTVRAGGQVWTILNSVMMDERVLQNPREFRLDRPAHHNLQFGYGLHNCLGRALTEVQLPLTLKAVLSEPRLRLTPGPLGVLEKDGPYPRCLSIDY